MRLIDADEFKKFIVELPRLENGFSDVYGQETICDFSDEQPTVEAIPVELVKKKLLLEKYEYDNDYDKGFDKGWNCALRTVLKDWRKKHEID